MLMASRRNHEIAELTLLDRYLYSHLDPRQIAREKPALINQALVLTLSVAFQEED